MAVLVEGISLVIRADAIVREFGEDIQDFLYLIPNQTLCMDGELVRVGFMVPDDVKAFVAKLEKVGLVNLANEKAVDMVVADQQCGLMADCDRVDFGHMDVDENQEVAACRLLGTQEPRLFTPEGWTYERSLSSSYAFVPAGQEDKSLTYLRHENGLDVYFNQLTGKEVYVGRTGMT